MSQLQLFLPAIFDVVAFKIVVIDEKTNLAAMSP